MLVVKQSESRERDSRRVCEEIGIARFRCYPVKAPLRDSHLPTHETFRRQAERNQDGIALSFLTTVSAREGQVSGFRVVRFSGGNRGISPKRLLRRGKALITQGLKPATNLIVRKWLTPTPIPAAQCATCMLRHCLVARRIKPLQLSLSNGNY